MDGSGYTNPKREGYHVTCYSERAFDLPKVDGFKSIARVRVAEFEARKLSRDR